MAKKSKSTVKKSLLKNTSDKKLYTLLVDVTVGSEKNKEVKKAGDKVPLTIEGYKYFKSMSYVK